MHDRHTRYVYAQTSAPTQFLPRGCHLDASALLCRKKVEGLRRPGCGGVRLHDLRHTFETKNIRKADMARVQEWMGQGHRDQAHTSRRARPTRGWSPRQSPSISRLLTFPNTLLPLRNKHPKKEVDAALQEAELSASASRPTAAKGRHVLPRRLRRSVSGVPLDLEQPR